METNKKLFFGVDATTIKIKELLNKDFLELSMKAISDENPNRNNTWFTYDSLVSCKDTFFNKPILGYFKNNDFVSHNGKWSKDEELNMEYWDTLGEGERCIGLIRESDNIEIIEDEKGLHWITLSCALWTSYSYKQIKRLIKDAIKAQKDGTPTKNISVEVNLLDYEEVEGSTPGLKIVKINSFELVGITILGSRNGVKVEPGIEGAELSIVDMMDAEIYDKQVNKLRLAYEKLGDRKNINKEDTDMDEVVVNNAQVEEINETTSVNDTVANETVSNEVNIVTTETDPQVTFEVNVNDNGTSETVVTNENTSTVEEVNNAGINEQNPKENFEADPVYNLTYAINRIHDLVGELEYCIGYYKKEGVIGGEYIIALLEKNKAILNKQEKDIADALTKVLSADYSDNKEEIEYQNELAENCDCNALYSQVKDKEKEIDTLKEEKINFEVLIKENENKYSDYEDIKARLLEFEKTALYNKAVELTGIAELSEVQTIEVLNNCKAGKYANEQAIKTEVALMAFEAKPKIQKTMYQAPVIDTPIIDNNTEEAETSVKKKSCWDVLHNYGKK